MVLKNFRNEIDEIDSEILKLLDERMAVALKVAKYKEANKLPVLNSNREQDIFNNIEQKVSNDIKDYIKEIYKEILNQSKLYQNSYMNENHFDNSHCCGLVGEHLSHSFSKSLHQLYAPYPYKLFEIPPTNLETFIKNKNYMGLNVTIPYKVEVMKYCDHIDDIAKEIGSVNTIYLKDNEIYGTNTDYDGFMYLTKTANIDFSNKVVLILGSGGASLTVQKAAKDLGASKVYVASRNGEINYQNLPYEAQIIVNTTPIGTYPNNSQKLLDLELFKKLNGVIDLIYNPQKTPLLLQASNLGVKYANGLAMLVGQGTAASEFWSKDFKYTSLNSILTIELTKQKTNIILIGMPGSGKSTIGKILASLLKMPFVDTDQEINKFGKNPADIIIQSGEAHFRTIESQVISQLSKQQGQVIATGGGSVLSEDNQNALRQNGIIIHINRDLNLLSTNARPLSKDIATLTSLYKTRFPIYNRLMDFTVDNNGEISQAITNVIEQLGGYYEKNHFNR
ncbi:MAG: chorismate mutase [Anaerovoracaceae bacterium]